MDIFLTSDNHLFFWGGNWQYFLQKWPVCFFQDNRRKLCQSSSEQISDIGELAKWWFSKIYFRSDNHLCFLLKKWALFYHPWPTSPGRCVFSRTIRESSVRAVQSKWGVIIDLGGPSVNTVHWTHCLSSVYTVQSTITRERCSRHCIVNIVYSTVFSLVIVKCTVQCALTIREPCSLTTPKNMVHSAIKPLFTISDQSLWWSRVC